MHYYSVQCIQKHCLCVQYVKALHVRRWMWWWTRTMNGPALKDGLNFKSPFRRVQTELIRVCWYSERRPGPPCVLARIYGSSHVLRKSTLSPPPTPASFSPSSLFLSKVLINSQPPLEVWDSSLHFVIGSGVTNPPSFAPVLFLPLVLSLMEGSGLLFSPLGSASLWPGFGQKKSH